MAKSKENLKIEIGESTNDNQRVITVTLSAPVQDFLLPDLLAERKAIRPLAETLKHSIRQAMEAYLGGAEELVAGLAAGRIGHSGESKTKEAGPKQSRNGNDKPTKTEGSSVSSKRDVTVEKSLDSSTGETHKTDQTASVSGR